MTLVNDAIVGTLAGFGAGALLVWSVCRRLARAEVAHAGAAATAAADARANAEITVLRERLARHEADADLTDRHGNVAELLAPIQETLGRYDEALRQIGRAQAQSAGALGERLDAVAVTGEALRRETQLLQQALRAPTTRGQWGELQLRRVCELAGMMAHCDFELQATVRSDDGTQRPDLVVRLPGGRRLVVDAKVPLAAYLEAVNASDDRARSARLVEHATALRAHVGRLSAKRYWAQFSDAPEFVVLFLPGESYFAAAMEADPSLLEAALTDRVLVATPTTLIALLKSAAYGWQQERVAEDAARVASLGRELQDRLGTFAEQLAEVGRGLARAAQSYNRAVGSLESRVLVSARRLGATDHIDGLLPAPALVETALRETALRETAPRDPARADTVS